MGTSSILLRNDRLLRIYKTELEQAAVRLQKDLNRPQIRTIENIAMNKRAKETRPLRLLVILL